jgi:hypothetical protein
MTRWRSFFEVAIAHEYFLSRGDVVGEALAPTERSAIARLSDVRRVLEVRPDDATLATLRGHRMAFRATETGFFVAVPIDPLASDLRPLLPPRSDFALTFYLALRDARFANYTELGATTTGFHRFGNDSGNSVAGTAYLSRPVPPFAATRAYAAGETYAQAAGASFDLFLALRDTGPSATPNPADWRRIPRDTFDATATYQAGAIVLSANQLFRARVDGPGTDLAKATDWEAIGTLGNQYVTAADAVRIVGSLPELDVSDLALAQVTVHLLRGNEVVPVLEQTFATDTGTLATVQPDLRGLPPGTYRIEFLDAAQSVLAGRGITIHLAPQKLREGVWGVIEIGAGNGDFALLKGDGTLRSPRFVLRLLNRSTRWRYIFAAPQTVGAGADVAADGGDARVLVTPAPRPLTRFGAGSRLQADSAATPATSEEILLPLPEVDRVRREPAGWFSETHLANLTVGP